MKRLLLLCLLGVAGAAAAYVLPGSAILRRLVEAREELHLVGAKVEGTLALSGGAMGELSTELPDYRTDAAFLMRVPGRCRLDATTPEGKPLAVVEAFGRRRVEGPPVAALGVALQEVCALLALRSASEGDARGGLEQHLRSLNVDTQKTALGRFGGQVVYVLGGDNAGDGQLWVFKESFLPARVRYTDDKGVVWDVRFSDYASPSTGGWFPRLLEVSRGNELELRFTTVRGDSRANVPERLF
ncbi:MAG: hypothetical protein ACLPJH_17705 [Myxococcaceae bacterium]